jgi:hypothetical protein
MPVISKLAAGMMAAASRETLAPEMREKPAPVKLAPGLRE